MVRAHAAQEGERCERGGAPGWEAAAHEHAACVEGEAVRREEEVDVCGVDAGGFGGGELRLPVPVAGGEEDGLGDVVEGFVDDVVELDVQVCDERVEVDPPQPVVRAFVDEALEHGELVPHDADVVLLGGFVVDGEGVVVLVRVGCVWDGIVSIQLDERVTILREVKTVVIIERRDVDKGTHHAYSSSLNMYNSFHSS